MSEKIKRVRRYLVIAVDLDIDCRNTDQDPADHADEIADYVGSNLDYSVRFDDECEAGQDASNSILVPVKIVKTESIGFLDSKPLDCT